MSAIGMGATLCARGVRKSSLIHPMGLSGGGAAFSPLSLAPVLWLKANVGLFQDVAGTIPAVADADPVGLWKDQSGSVNNLSQSTDANRPTLKLAIQNGNAVIRFDAVNDFLSFTGITLSGNFSIFVVCKQTGDNGIFGKGPASSAPQFRIGPSSANKLNTNDGTNDNLSSTLGTAQGSWSILELVDTATVMAYYQGGTAYGTGTFLAGQIINELGCLSGSSNLFNGDMGEVIVYPTALSAANRILVEVYLKARWGTP